MSIWQGTNLGQFASSHPRLDGLSPPSGVDVDASTIAEDINDLVAGEAVVGPRYRDPFGAVRVATEVLHGALLGYQKHFKVGDLKTIDQARAAMNRALAEYQMSGGLV